MPSDEHYSAEPGRSGPPPGDNGGGRAEPVLTAEIQRQVTGLAQRRPLPDFGQAVQVLDGI